MVRSLSVEVIANRSNPIFVTLTRAIRNMQNNDTTRLDWQRAFFVSGRRFLPSNIECKLREVSSLNRQRAAFKQVIPKLKK